MLIGRHDIEQLMRLDPASSCLPNAFGQSNIENHASDSENLEVELELSDLLLNLRPIKQVFKLLFDVTSYSFHLNVQHVIFILFLVFICSVKDFRLTSLQIM